MEAERPELARKVRWVALEDGDGAGYDALSFDARRHERLLEVKTTNGSARTPFFLARTEREVAEERADARCIYRVHQFGREPRIFTLPLPLEKLSRLSLGNKTGLGKRRHCCDDKWRRGLILRVPAVSPCPAQWAAAASPGTSRFRPILRRTQ